MALCKRGLQPEKPEEVRAAIAARRATRDFFSQEKLSSYLIPQSSQTQPTPEPLHFASCLGLVSFSLPSLLHPSS